MTRSQSRNQTLIEAVRRFYYVQICGIGYTTKRKAVTCIAHGTAFFVLKIRKAYGIIRIAIYAMRHGGMGMDRKDYIIELRDRTGMTRKEFCEYFDIPYRTLQDWELGNRKMPDYLLRLMEYKLLMEKKIKNDGEEKTDGKEE